MLCGVSVAGDDEAAGTGEAVTTAGLRAAGVLAEVALLDDGGVTCWTTGASALGSGGAGLLLSSSGVMGAGGWSGTKRFCFVPSSSSEPSPCGVVVSSGSGAALWSPAAAGAWVTGSGLEIPVSCSDGLSLVDAEGWSADAAAAGFAVRSFAFAGVAEDIAAEAGDFAVC